MKRIRTSNRIIAAILSMLMLSSFLTACSEKAVDNSSVVSDSGSSEEFQPAVTTEQIVEAISESIQPEVQPLAISYDWEDYVGNIDAFVYGLIVNEYELCYNVFDAVIDLPDGTSVYGIGYTDYADYYETDDEKGFFPCGFISLIGEPDIPPEYIDNGLEVTDLEYDDPKSGFVLAYDTEAFMEHCVIWEQYLQYGVDDRGQITYECQPYERGKCNESLGSLYSYDEKRCVVDFDVGDYVALTGIPLSQSLDYSALEDEINRIIEEQDKNFAQVDIETYISFAHEAVNSYLLSMQEETFMGIPVKELIEISKDLDPMECIRITPDGAVLVDIGTDIPEKPDALTKWLVGVSCGIVVADSIALDIFVPALTPVSGAISGAAVEVFMQVVFENQTLENVQWSKVAVSAVSGAVMAWACPLAAGAVSEKVVNIAGKECVKILGKEIATESLAKLAGYATLTFSNALVSGATGAAFSAIDGKSSDEVFDSFLIGAALGGAFTAGAAALGEVGGKVLTKLAEKKPNNWLIKVMGKADDFVSEHQIHLDNHKELENILAPKSVHEATKSALSEFDFFKTKISTLVAEENKNFVLVDSTGKVLTKNDLIENGGNCFIKLADDCDDEAKKLFEKYNVTKIPVKDGVVDFSDFSVYEFKSNKPISKDRDKNYDNFFKQLADDWNKDPSKIPDVISKNISEDKIGSLNKTNVKNAISASGLTPHESLDNMVYLVDKSTHFGKNKIGHAGGVSYAKLQAEVHTASKYFNMLSNAEASAVYGVLIAEEVSD